MDTFLIGYGSRLCLWSVKDQWKVPTSAVIQMQVYICVCYNTEFIAISPNICLGCRAGQWLGVGGRRERGCVCSDSVPLEDQSKFWPNYQHVYTYTSGPCHLLLSEGEHGSGPTRTNSFSQDENTCAPGGLSEVTERHITFLVQNWKHNLFYVVWDWGSEVMILCHSLPLHQIGSVWLTLGSLLDWVSLFLNHIDWCSVPNSLIKDQFVRHWINWATLALFWTSVVLFLF